MGRGTLSWLLLTIGVSSCVSVQNPEALRQVVQGNTQFSTQLYDVIRQQHQSKNFVVSPTSVSTILAMLQAGAQGQTQGQIRTSLHFPSDNQQLHNGYRSLLQHLQASPTDQVALRMINKIYPATGFQLNSQYVQTLKDYYFSQPQQLNYATDKTEAVRTINNYVVAATQNNITNVIQSSDISEATKMVLINALYFQGQFKQPFSPQHTQQSKFYTSETDYKNVQMMQNTVNVLHAQIPELDAQVVSIPYKGDRFSLMVVVPNKRAGITDLEKKLKNYPVDKIVAQMTQKMVTLSLPKFQIESQTDLQQPLGQLGLSEIFSPEQANFQGISQEKLLVSKAIQKVVMKVNEYGSDTAAASAAGGLANTTSNKNEVRVIADHPFTAFVVVNQQDQVPTTPLVMARVSNPESQ